MKNYLKYKEMKYHLITIVWKIYSIEFSKHEFRLYLLYASSYRFLIIVLKSNECLR